MCLTASFSHHYQTSIYVLSTTNLVIDYVDMKDSFSVVIRTVTAQRINTGTGGSPGGAEIPAVVGGSDRP